MFLNFVFNIFFRIKIQSNVSSSIREVSLKERKRSLNHIRCIKEIFRKFLFSKKHAINRCFTAGVTSSYFEPLFTLGPASLANMQTIQLPTQNTLLTCSITCTQRIISFSIFYHDASFIRTEGTMTLWYILRE